MLRRLLLQMNRINGSFIVSMLSRLFPILLHWHANIAYASVGAESALVPGCSATIREQCKPVMNVCENRNLNPSQRDTAS